MCGRYILTTPGETLQALFEVTAWVQMRPRYNIAPMQDMAIVRAASSGQGREAALVRWGFVPHWADDPSIGSRMINARSETAATKPAFRDSFRARRCLIPADGFFEWRATPAGKRPVLIRAEDHRTIAFAGLWSEWGTPSERLQTCTILTTNATPQLRELHERMPVVLGSEHHTAWLNPASPTEALQHLLQPFAEALELQPVSARVNSPKHDDPSLLMPVGKEGEPGEQRSLF